MRIGVQEGWLETRRGSGIWPRGSLPQAIPKPPRFDSVRLAEQLRAEILAGRFGSGQFLPSPKLHSRQVRVHAATVRKAYGTLVSQGLVERVGRGWMVAPPRARRPSHSPALLCIGAAGNDGRLLVDSDREWDFWREIQLEATRCGLEPVLLAVGETTPEIDANAFGALVSNWHMADSGALLDALQKSRLPTAVWAATEEPLPGERYRQARNLWFHDLAHGRGAGETMAEFATALGHRKIAWISPFHASTWSQNRLEGLRASLPPSVEVVEAVHGWISEWDVQVQLAWNPEVTRRLDLEGIAHPSDPDRLRRPLVDMLTRKRCMERFGPRLEAALDSGATLWIAGSDLIAHWCLQWLEERGIRPPHGLGLASFDDTREATRLDVTSLRFDVQGMARAMVRQILSSRESHKLLTRYAGSVVRRASTSGFDAEPGAAGTSRPARIRI